MDYLDFETYLEECATNVIAIGHTPTEKHFVMCDIEEVFSAIKHELEYPALIGENPEMGQQDNLSDNIHSITGGAFMILSPCEDSDQVELKRVKTDNFLIAKDVVKKMYNNLKQGNLNGFDLNSVRYNYVNNVFEKHYGWRVSFVIKHWENMTLDESKYTNETKFEI